MLCTGDSSDEKESHRLNVKRKENDTPWKHSLKEAVVAVISSGLSKEINMAILNIYIPIIWRAQKKWTNAKILPKINQEDIYFLKKPE